MTISIHTLAIDTYVPAMRSLLGLLDKAAEYAKSKGTDADSLLQERLAPDMFPLSLQIQLVCHHAKDGTARITGAEPPKIEAKELNFAGHKTLVEATIQTLTGMSAKAFEGGEERKVELSLQGQRMFESNGFEFLCHWSFAHFYFHLVTAYDILRHNGVQLGKRDYMSGISAAHIRQLAQT